MADSPLSQADLEARITDLTDERDGLIDALIRAEDDRDEALAASRQPVGYRVRLEGRWVAFHPDDVQVASRPPVSGDGRPWHERRAELLKDGWREGADKLWRNPRFGGSYKRDNATQRVGSRQGEVTRPAVSGGPEGDAGLRELAEAIKPLLGTMNYYFGPAARPLASGEWTAQYKRVAEIVNTVLSRVPADGDEGPACDCGHAGTPEDKHRNTCARGRWMLIRDAGFVPADGEQPAGELYPSYPEHNEVDEAASRASRQERPPERMEDLIREGRMHAGDDVEEHPPEPVEREFTDPTDRADPTVRERPPDLKVDPSPAFNAWQGEQPGLGDLQLTEALDLLAEVEPFLGSFAMSQEAEESWSQRVALLRRLASRETDG